MTESNVLQGSRISRRGGILAWLLATFLLVSIAVAFACALFVKSIRVKESKTGNDVQVDTPFGSVHVQHTGNGRRETAGLPLYPGAKPVRNESATVDLSEILGDKDLRIVAGKWKTSDPIDKVQKFYEDKFPDMRVIQHPGKVEMHSIDGHSKKIIALCEKNGATEIALASVGEPKAN
jgi:hypothetical protein